MSETGRMGDGPWRRLVVMLAVAMVLAACQRGCEGTGSGSGGPATRSVPESPRSLADGITVGKPATFANLTMFPILATNQTDLGPFTSLERAVAKEQAEVRELGPELEPVEPEMAERRAGNLRFRQRRVAGPRVNQLVIENRGDVPIYVLAGTIVKGGNQDRQIGQDFIVAAHATTPVDAFCVEHGRWSGTRGGAETRGRFAPLGQLATTKVRTAAQYQRNQSEVWSKVGALNAAHGKTGPTDTLLGTLEDGEVARQRAALGENLNRFLDGIEPAQGVVGIAYAIGGKVQSVRWFAHHSLFKLFRDTLIATAAADAVTATTAGGVAPPVPVSVQSVKSFLAELDATPEGEVRPATSANSNGYAEAEHGYRSKTLLKLGTRPPRAISQDYAAK